MKTYILILTVLLLNFSTNAQSPSFEWARNMGGSSADYGNSVTVDASGNVYTTGRFSGTADFDPGAGTFNLISAGSDDIFISKLNSSGDFIWAKRIGGASDDLGYAITTDAAGNIYTTGYFKATADFDPGAGIVNLTSAGAEDIFVLKLDASGNFIWAKSMRGTLTDIGNSIAVDASGNVYTTGLFTGTVDFDPGAATFNLISAGNYDIFISKLDASGNFVWAKQMGGADFDVSRSIKLDASGNIYTTGYFQYTVDFDPGAGVFNLTSVYDDIFISKLDNSGNFIWAKNMGSGDTDGLGIAIDPAGNVYTTGFFNGSSADFDPGAGTFNLTSYGGSDDIFISKLDASGNFVWAKNVAGASADVGASIAVDGSGDVYSTGEFGGTADFNPGAGTFNLTSSSGLGAFILKLDTSGNFLWAKNIGGTEGNSITVDAFGNIYTAGFFSGTTDFDPDAAVFNLTCAGGSDIFVHKMSQANGTTTGITENISENNISIYPNPTDGVFNIALALSEKNTSIEIYNSIGELVYSKQNTGTQTLIDLKNNATGLYFVKIISENKIIGTKKIVKE